MSHAWRVCLTELQEVSDLNDLSVLGRGGQSGNDVENQLLAVVIFLFQVVLQKIQTACKQSSFIAVSRISLVVSVIIITVLC